MSNETPGGGEGFDEAAIAVQRLRNLCAGIQCEFVSLAALAVTKSDFERHLIERLVVAMHGGVGCALLAENRLAPPLASVSRSILENLFAVYWATKSPANSAAVLDAAQGELMRAIRVNLERGAATIVDRMTKESRTGTLLRDRRMKAARKSISFETMARDSGLGRVYDQIYRINSVMAHTTSPELFVRGDQDKYIGATVIATTAVLECLRLIVVNHVRESRTTELSELSAVLKVPLQSA